MSAFFVLLAAAGANLGGLLITDAEMAALQPRAVEARQLAKAKLAPVDYTHSNRHILFRRDFTLEKVSRATVDITADDYYKLYVNGEYVTEGPAAGTVDNTYWHTVDVSRHVRPGRNVIAVHTYYQGLVNRVWTSGDNRHGLWLELRVDGRTVVKSDERFRTARHTGYSAIGKAGYDTQFLERYDAGAPEVGFERVDYDDSSWSMAVPHPRGGDYVLSTLPGVETPRVEVERIAPKSVVRRSDGSLDVDFGGIYVGRVYLAAKGPKGAEMRLRCAQELSPDGSVRWRMRCNCNYEEAFVLSGAGHDELRQFDYKSFRYLNVTIPPGVELDENSIALEARHLPFHAIVSPKFDDPDLARIWKLCEDSFHYGVQEQVMDCMDREKGYYLGDGCYTIYAYARLTGRWDLVRKFFDDFLRTSRIDRGLVTCGNCSFMQEIAEYPLMMFPLAEWYVDATRDGAFIASRLDAFRDILDCYRERYIGTSGLISSIDKWCVVEWPANFRDEYDADVREGKVCTDVHNVINAWYVGAVKSYNRLAEKLGKPVVAGANELERAFRAAFYDRERHLFVDRVGSSHASMPGNVYAAYFRLAPPEDAAEFHRRFVRMVREKRFSAISMFQFYPLFSYLRDSGEKELLRELVLSPDSWKRNLREGATRSFEGWGRDTKWNTSLFHLTISSVSVFLEDMATH